MIDLILEDFEEKLTGATKDPYNQAVLRLGHIMFLHHGGLYPLQRCVEIVWEIGGDFAQQGYSTSEIISGLNGAAEAIRAEHNKPTP